MSLIESFTKPQWQHRKPEVRKAAIDQLDDQAVLIDLVCSDPDAEVRAHALSRVSNGEKLDELINTLPHLCNNRPGLNACSNCCRTEPAFNRLKTTASLFVSPVSPMIRN